MRIKCTNCINGYNWYPISGKWLDCITCYGKGYLAASLVEKIIDTKQYRVINKFTGEQRIGFYISLCELDKRIWSFLHISHTKPLMMETSLCNLFNGYFGFDLLRHPVNSLHDLKGYYV